MAIDVTVALDSHDQLGEGPVWDERTGELLRVDITGRRVLAWDPSSGSERVVATPDGDVSAVVLTESGPPVLAVERSLMSGGSGVIATLGPPHPDIRFNDCRASPDGRLWAGTMSRTRATGTAGLYRLGASGALELVVSDLTISNGLAWSEDTMYLVDSTTQRIDAFDHRGGELSNRRPFASVNPADGLPDGIALDAEGGLWVCLFGGGAVRRYSPDGNLDAHIPLPVTNPTCPTFGGSDHATLFITSARHRLSPEQLAAEPLAGAVLALTPGVGGRPANRLLPCAPCTDLSSLRP